MVADYAKHLAAAIITENQIVTYRLLARELKVHANVAKRMLFVFHQKQNAKKTGSIHATYLITGYQNQAAPASRLPENVDGDIPMPSSPFMSSAANPDDHGDDEPTKLKVLTLVGEEKLEATKTKYDSIVSIHVYSLEPSRLQNMQVLSAVTQKIIADYISLDPLTHNKTYGIIQNPHVKRRTGARPPPALLPIKAETKTAFAKTKDPKAEANKTLSKPKEAPPGSGEQATKVVAPALNKRESSDLFKSFAKTKPKVKKEDIKPTKHSHHVPMKDVSDDDDDGGGDVDLDLVTKGETEAQREARLEKAEKLRRLAEESDDDDQPMPDAVDPKVESEDESEAEPEEEEEEGGPPSAPIDAPEPPQPEEAEPPVVVSDGRRRGRRKVMKKKMTRDAEGYLVTKEEAVWESFSEDDVPPPTAKSTAATSSSSAKMKKPAGKPGQGNIMSFFGKK